MESVMVEAGSIMLHPCPALVHCWYNTQIFSMCTLWRILVKSVYWSTTIRKTLQSNAQKMQLRKSNSQKKRVYLHGVIFSNLKILRCKFKHELGAKLYFQAFEETTAHIWGKFENNSKQMLRLMKKEEREHIWGKCGKKAWVGKMDGQLSSLTSASGLRHSGNWDVKALKCGQMQSISASS